MSDSGVGGASGIGRSGAAVLLLLASMTAPPRVDAQMPVGQGEAVLRWALQGPQVSFCIEFLMDSSAATKQVRKTDKGYQVVRADVFGPLHPALQAMIERRPEFQTWVPSSLCIIASDSVSVGGRLSTSDDEDNRQMVGFWAVAAKPEGSNGVDSLYAVPFMFTNNHRIARNSELGGIKLETLTERFDVVPETGDRRYEVKIQKAELRWDGHLAGDEPDPGATREWAFVVRGKRSVLLLGRGRIDPGHQQPIVGSLKIGGKGDLAKALQASPMRMQGPAFWAGSGSFEFFSEF